MGSRLVMGQGPIPSLGMIVGEAPGREEERLGAPFVGSSGKRLEEALNMAGAKRDEFYVTNVYKLRPPENRDPTDEELVAHWPYLTMELQAVKPEFILLLGRIALKNFFKDKPSISAERGLWAEKHDLAFLPTFHPAATIYDKTKLPLFQEDVQTFVEAVRAYVATDVDS